MKSKALELLMKSKTVDQRASQFLQIAKEDIHLDLIKPLERKLVEIDNKIFELEDFTLETNLNKNMKRMSAEDIKSSFTQIIKLGYERDLVEAELSSMKARYDHYFTEKEEVANAET